MSFPQYQACTKILLAAALCVAAVPSNAQGPQAAAAPGIPVAFPTKLVDITVPYAAGGGVDILARLIASQLTAQGHSVVVENRAGAGGTLAARYVTTRPKDGHSLLMMNDAYSLAPAIYKGLPYDPRKDLEAVVSVASAPMLVLVPGNSSFKSLADIVAAGTRPGATLAYASCGAGTDPHLAGEMLNLAFKMEATHVPYKGCAPAMVDVLGGQVDYGVITISGALPYLASGKMRALAITSRERSKAAPGVPTVAESGAPGYELSQWQGLAVPAGTPEETKQAIYRIVSGIIKTDNMQKKLFELGYTPLNENPAEFQKTVNNDIQRFAELSKKIGLKAD